MLCEGSGETRCGSASAPCDRLAEIRRHLERFDLSQAHCTNPNEDKRLRAAIRTAPGGANAFQATIQGLSKQLQENKSDNFATI